MELKGEPNALVSSVYVEIRGLHRHIHVRSRGKTVGMLTLDEADAAPMISRLLGPQAHEHTEAGSILDRCISLVQSMARLDVGGAIAGIDNVLDEAAAIAKDAGWT